MCKLIDKIFPLIYFLFVCTNTPKKLKFISEGKHRKKNQQTKYASEAKKLIRHKNVIKSWENRQTHFCRVSVEPAPNS